jgi:hypothetical protein
MAHKQVLFHFAAREKLLRGASLLTEATMTDLPEPKEKARSPMEPEV